MKCRNTTGYTCTPSRRWKHGCARDSTAAASKVNFKSSSLGSNDLCYVCGLDSNAVFKYPLLLARVIDPGILSPSDACGPVSSELKPSTLCLVPVWWSQQPPLVVASPNWLPLQREYMVALGTAQQAVLQLFIAMCCVMPDRHGMILGRACKEDRQSGPRAPSRLGGSGQGRLSPRRADGACADCPKPYALGRDLRANVALTSTTLAFSQTALLS